MRIFRKTKQKKKGTPGHLSSTKGTYLINYLRLQGKHYPQLLWDKRLRRGGGGWYWEKVTHKPLGGEGESLRPDILRNAPTTIIAVKYPIQNGHFIGVCPKKGSDRVLHVFYPCAFKVLDSSSLPQTISTWQGTPPPSNLE